MIVKLSRISILVFALLLFGCSDTQNQTRASTFQGQKIGVLYVSHGGNETHKEPLLWVFHCMKGVWFVIDQNTENRLIKGWSVAGLLNFSFAYSRPSAPGFIRFFGSTDFFIALRVSAARVCLPF